MLLAEMSNNHFDSETLPDTYLKLQPLTRLTFTLAGRLPSELLSCSNVGRNENDE